MNLSPTKWLGTIINCTRVNGDIRRNGFDQNKHPQNHSSKNQAMWCYMDLLFQEMGKLQTQESQKICIISLKVRDFRLSALHPQHSSVSKQFFRPPNALRRKDGEKLMLSLITCWNPGCSVEFAKFHNPSEVDGWSLAVLDTSRLITLFCLVALLRSKTLAADTVAVSDIRRSRLRWRSRFDPLLGCPMAQDLQEVHEN